MPMATEPPLSHTYADGMAPSATGGVAESPPAATAAVDTKTVDKILKNSLCMKTHSLVSDLVRDSFGFWLRAIFYRIDCPTRRIGQKQHDLRGACIPARAISRCQHRADEWMIG